MGMQLGELIAVGRECKGWTLRRLERECGVSNALISQIERGEVKDPGFTTVVKILDALGIKLDRAAQPARDRLKMLRDADARKPFGASATPPTKERQG